MRPHITHLILFATIVASIAVTASAEVPQMINYQGRLTDGGGVPLSGTYDFNFRIYDAETDGTELWHETHNSVTVTDGLFTVILGKGTTPVPISDEVFNGPDRWLGITVGTDPEIVPRTRLTSVGYSHRVSTVDGASGGDVYGDIHLHSTLTLGDNSGSSGRLEITDGTSTTISADGSSGNVGIGTDSPSSALHIYDDIDGILDLVVENPSTGVNSQERIIFRDENGDVAFVGATDVNSPLYHGRLSVANHRPGGSVQLSTSGGYLELDDNGYLGLNCTPSTSLHLCGNPGVDGIRFPDGTKQTTAANAESSGWIDDDNVVKLEASTDSVGIGTSSPSGKLHVIGDSYVEGEVLVVENYDTPDYKDGVYAHITNSGTGQLTAFDGVVYSDADFRYGVWTYVSTVDDSTAGYSTGLRGSSRYGDRSIGVNADASRGQTTYGVQAYSTASVGTGYGVYASASSSGGNGYGLYSIASQNDGTAYGLRALASNNGGTGYGIYASAADNATNWAGYFNGDVRVTGTLDNSKSSYVIDHPLDPQNKYIRHSSISSPDMMNVYNGNVLLDADGEATVELPDYFDALNRDFRYQLTCVGGFAPVYIAQQISGNEFTIAGGEPGMMVSWQVTGIRKDAYAEANRIEVEVDKSPDEQGKYLHPEAFGVDETLGINYHSPDEDPLIPVKVK